MATTRSPGAVVQRLYSPRDDQVLQALRELHDADSAFRRDAVALGVVQTVVELVCRRTAPLHVDRGVSVHARSARGPARTVNEEAEAGVVTCAALVFLRTALTDDEHGASPTWAHALAPHAGALLVCVDSTRAAQHAAALLLSAVDSCAGDEVASALVRAGAIGRLTRSMVALSSANEREESIPDAPPALGDCVSCIAALVSGRHAAPRAALVEFVRAGGAHVLASALRQQGRVGARAVGAACRLLLATLEDDATRSAIPAERNLLRSVVAAVACEESKRDAMHSVQFLARDEANREALADAGLDEFAALLFDSSIDAQLLASRVLSELVQNDNCARRLATVGVVCNLLRAVDTRTDESARAELQRLLHSVSRHATSGKFARSADFIELARSLCQRKTGLRADLREPLLVVTCNVAAKRTACAALLDSGVVDAVLELAFDAGDARDVQALVPQLLERVVQDDELCGSLGKRATLWPVMAELVTRCRLDGSAASVLRCTQALLRDADGKRAALEAGVLPRLGTLALPPSSLHIRTEAVRAIASLVNRSRDAVKNAVLDCAAVPQALARALDSALDDVGAHDLACSAAQLAEQLSGDGRSAHLIRAARLHELLRDAVQRVLAEQHSSPEDTGDAVGLMLACMRALLAIRTTLPSGRAQEWDDGFAATLADTCRNAELLGAAPSAPAEGTRNASQSESLAILARRLREVQTASTDCQLDASTAALRSSSRATLRVASALAAHAPRRASCTVSAAAFVLGDRESRQRVAVCDPLPRAAYSQNAAATTARAAQLTPRRTLPIAAALADTCVYAISRAGAGDSAHVVRAATTP